MKVEVDVLGSPSLIVPYGLSCGRKATLKNTELRSCVTDQVAVLGFPVPKQDQVAVLGFPVPKQALIMVSVDVKRHV